MTTLSDLFTFTDLETSALEEKNKRDHYTQLVGACLVSITLSADRTNCMPLSI